MIGNIKKNTHFTVFFDQDTLTLTLCIQSLQYLRLEMETRRTYEIYIFGSACLCFSSFESLVKYSRTFEIIAVLKF